MLKVLTLKEHTVLVTEDNLTIMFGAWSYTPWMNGRKKNDITPAKPIKDMKKAELNAFIKQGIEAGEKEQKKINEWFKGVVIK